MRGGSCLWLLVEVGGGQLSLHSLALAPGKEQQVQLLVHHFVFAGIDGYDGLQWVHWCLGGVKQTLLLSE